MSIRNDFVLRIIAFTALLTVVFIPYGNCQLTVNGGFTAAQLAQQLAGQGVAFSNVTLTCPNGAYGTFDGSLSNLGIDQGVLLTSGSIGNAVGPNTQTGVTTNNNAPGDADLSVITAPSATFDACVLEFDLQVNSDSLVFNYVFGSDEYHEYVNSAFNDVFAFFISGPGIAGQQNIAIIPTTTTPVSINNVNNGNFACPGPPTGPCSWCQYFVNNCNGATIEYDAFTTVLTATIGSLQPCQTYHLKLAVSDAGDGILDSGVFLEAGSFVAVNVDILPTTSVGFGFNNAVEGCVDGIFEFHLDPPPVDTYQVNYTIGGTAINGIDYVMIADSLVFMPGDTFDQLIIETFVDSIIEGLESVTLYLVNECTGLPYDSATLMIQDSVFAVAATLDDTICRGELVQLTASGGIFYNWSPGKYLNDSTIANPIAQPDSTMTFSVRVDVGNCFESDSVTITVIDANFSVSAFGDDTICKNEVIPLGLNITGNQGPYQIIWRPGISLNDSTISSPFASPGVTTNYQAFVLGKNGCNLVDDVDVIVSGEGPRIFLESSRSIVCPGDTVELTAMQAPVTCGPDTIPCNGIPRTRSVGVGNITIPTGSPTQYPSVYGNWHN
ncbi:MAG: hypothetical protein HKN22_06910, partial [Bacteroidia bacterium]|nr:hypothetical protein [Bacteroidia bacterium]